MIKHLVKLTLALGASLGQENHVGLGEQITEHLAERSNPPGPGPALIFNMATLASNCSIGPVDVIATSGLGGLLISKPLSG